MGTEYYILDKDKDEIFELGKHVYLDEIKQNLSVWINDELSFRMKIIQELSENLPDWTVAYCVKISESIWNFCKNRKNIVIGSEHQLFDGYLEFNKCNLVGTRYTDYDSSYLKETSDRWASYYERNKKMHSPERFEELSKYYKETVK